MGLDRARVLLSWFRQLPLGFFLPFSFANIRKFGLRNTWRLVNQVWTLFLIRFILFYTRIYFFFECLFIDFGGLKYLLVFAAEPELRTQLLKNMFQGRIN